MRRRGLSSIENFNVLSPQIEFVKLSTYEYDVTELPLGTINFLNTLKDNISVDIKVGVKTKRKFHDLQFWFSIYVLQKHAMYGNFYFVIKNLYGSFDTLPP